MDFDLRLEKTGILWKDVWTAPSPDPRIAFKAFYIFTTAQRMVIFIFLYGLFVKCEKAAETYLECLQPLVPAPPSRAGNEPSTKIHNHGEGPSSATIESAY